MKLIGILFMQKMIATIVRGWKTQTRRLQGLEAINRNPDAWELLNIDRTADAITAIFKKKDGPQQRIRCPYGIPGDALWVREEQYRYGHWIKGGKKKDTGWQQYAFVADSNDVKYNDAPPDKFYKSRCKTDYTTPAWYKRNSRFMPRAACRSFLRIKNIAAERLWQISEADARAEGIMRWQSADEYFNYCRSLPDDKSRGEMNPHNIFKQEADLRKKWPESGLVYKQYISDLFTPVEVAITPDAKESFITLFLSVNPQRHMNLRHEMNNPWLWVVEFEKTDFPKDEKNIPE